MQFRARFDPLVHVTKDLFIPAGTLREIHKRILSNACASCDG
jgi:hypothetical protein